MQEEMEDKPRNFDNLYWSRPELCPLLAYESMASAEVEFKSPSIDLSCGDGLFTFAHLCGKFTPDFDCFQATRARELKHESFVDIYDSFEEDYTVKSARAPDWRVDVAPIANTPCSSGRSTPDKPLAGPDGRGLAA